MCKESIEGITDSFAPDFFGNSLTSKESLGNNAIIKKVIKLIKMYNRIGAKNVWRLPDKYSFVKAAGFKNK
jgi:hypothetical protein